MPTGGGFDLLAVTHSSEPDCIDFHIDGRLHVVVKPRSLNLERIGADAAQSFLMLELGSLQPSGAYDEERSQRIIERRLEEVVDLGGADYVSRDGRDYGVYEDEDGFERELPEDYRGVMRFMNGKIMLVAKSSIWNGFPSTYDGRHERMSTSMMRQVIEKLIADRVAA